jgi:hypothetical protein
VKRPCWKLLPILRVDEREFAPGRLSVYGFRPKRITWEWPTIRTLGRGRTIDQRSGNAGIVLLDGFLESIRHNVKAARSGLAGRYLVRRPQPS